MIRKVPRAIALITTVAIVLMLGSLYLFNFGVEEAFPLQKPAFALPPKYRGHYGETYVNRSVPQHIRTHDEETTFYDGVIQYTKIREGAEPDLLALTITYDHTSWGRERGAELRTIADFLQILVSQYDASRTSIGVLTSSQHEYTQYKSALQQSEFPRITILMHPGFHDGQIVDRAHRHDESIQTLRRAELARLRNYLMLKALQQERHILWLDADVFHLDDGIVAQMLSHVQVREDIGILTARCALTRWRENYDHNAWSGTRKGPRGWDLTDKEISNGEKRLQGQRLVSELIKGTTNEDLVSLDAVGGTILYMRASLVSQGLSFPYQYVVGTRWGKDGWDGLESEGVCYMARGLKSGKCMLLGGDWHVLHTTY